jgi:putative RecB family exonuclease
MEAPQNGSYTQYSTLNECGWKYKLKYLDGVQEDPCVWLPGGTAFHAAAEHIAREVWAGVVLDDDTLNAAVRVFRETFASELRKVLAIEPDESKLCVAGRKNGGRGQDVAWWDKNGPAMVKKYHDWWIVNRDRYGVATLPGSVPAVEAGGLTEQGPAPVKFYFDLIIVDLLTSAVILVDLKTGSRMPGGLQLGAYGTWIPRMFGGRPHYGTYYNARKGELEPWPPFVLDTWPPDRVDAWVADSSAKIRAGRFIANPGWQCKMCGVRKACSFAAGRTQADYALAR